MTGHEVNSEFCFVRIFDGNKIHCSPRDQSLSDLFNFIAKQNKTKANFEKRPEIPATTSGHF